MGDTYVAQAVSHGLMSVRLENGLFVLPQIIEIADTEKTEHEIARLHAQCYEKGKSLAQTALKSKKMDYDIPTMKEALARLWPM